MTHRSVTIPGVAALITGIVFGGILLLPTAYLCGPLGALLLLACGAFTFAAWGSGLGADLATNLEIGFLYALGVVIGCVGLFLLLGDGISGGLVVAVSCFACTIALSWIASICFALLQGCTKRIDERRRLRIRGISERRRALAKPQ